MGFNLAFKGLQDWIATTPLAIVKMSHYVQQGVSER